CRSPRERPPGSRPPWRRRSSREHLPELLGHVGDLRITVELRAPLRGAHPRDEARPERVDDERGMAGLAPCGRELLGARIERVGLLEGREEADVAARVREETEVVARDDQWCELR